MFKREVNKTQINKMEIFSSFNKSYFNFLLFIKKNMGNDAKFNSFYMKNFIIKETNVKLFIKTWYSRITRNYYNQVMNKDFDFFLNKSYKDDVEKNNTSGEAPTVMLTYITDFKNTFPSLADTVKYEFVSFMLHLTELSFLYFKE
jgi:hypothetical protein